MPSETSSHWLSALLGAQLPAEGGTLTISQQTFDMRGGILRSVDAVSMAQEQTREVFGYKWQKRDAFDSPMSRSNLHQWLRQRYGDVAAAEWWSSYGEQPLLLDAGCGAALSVLELFGDRLSQLRYLGVDISNSVDVAKVRFSESGLPGAFMQADMTKLPLPHGSVDVVFSEGALHHTDSTENALSALSRLLRVGGRLLFYVYRKKGPIREFSDDYIRGRLQEMSQEDAWNAMLPLSQLGKILGDLDIELTIPDDIDILQIPAGKINLQRLFYWHFCKMYFRPEFDTNEMNLINFDWFAPANAHRHTAEEVHSWCERLELQIERQVVEEAGITVIARKAA